MRSTNAASTFHREIPVRRRYIIRYEFSIHSALDALLSLRYSRRISDVLVLPVPAQYSFEADRIVSRKLYVSASEWRARSFSRLASIPSVISNSTITRLFIASTSRFPIYYCFCIASSVRNVYIFLCRRHTALRPPKTSYVFVEKIPRETEEIRMNESRLSTMLGHALGIVDAE